LGRRLRVRRIHVRTKGRDTGTAAKVSKALRKKKRGEEVRRMNTNARERGRYRDSNKGSTAPSIKYNLSW
jgi:hypothetical protein